MTIKTESPERELLARSLVQIKQLRKQVAELHDQEHEPIAIIGVGLRLPGGIGDLGALRSRLLDGFDAVTGIPLERWDLAPLFDADPDALGKMYTRHGAFLDSIDTFDAAFFGVSPKEAAAMDPQQRLFLEVVHEALERAGVDVSSLEESRTAVYAGATTWDYGARQVFGRTLSSLDPYVMSGNIAAFTSGRISYTYGLQGPCMSIDTACSSSLVAVHLAVGALRKREAELAIAGGVNVILAPEWNVVLSRARMMAPDGRCKTFDVAADGYVRGEGCGVVVLKRLSAAQRDGDSVLAVIRGSAINQDGPASGITVPNGLAQQKVIRAALEDARVEASSVGYVEAHGTGTSLGDPIEVRSLGAVYGQNRADALRLGSIKTNVGHLEPAAGVVGLIKAALAVEFGEIYPHLHLREVNPEIDLASISAEIPVVASSWTSPAGQPRRAAISSFGASGTNAHVVIEQAPAPTDSPRGEERAPRLLVISAKTEPALHELVELQREALAQLPEASWADWCATSQVGRAAYPWRRAVVASTPADAAAQLTVLENGAASAAAVIAGRAGGTPPPVAMIFAGQGAQALQMGRQLYASQPTYRAAFDLCDALARPALGASLLEIIDGSDRERPLDHTAFTQPAIFAVEYALWQLWASWGIEPAAVLGHSVGQYVAAVVAGALEVPAALSLLIARGRLMQALPGEGAMYALAAPEARALELLGPFAATCSVAAVNGPQSVVISGLRPAIDRVAELARTAGIRVKALTVSHAFHSPQMEPLLDEFRREVVRAAPRAPQLPLACNLTGALAGAELANPEYWVRHLREPVRFGDGLAALSDRGYRVFVEASPRPTLSSMAKAQLAASHAVLPSIREGKPELETMLQTLGELFVRGASPRWRVVDDGPRRRVALPTYPFQRKRHWVDVEAGQRTVAPSADPAVAPSKHPLIDRRVPNPLAFAQFESRLGRSRHGFLADFVIDRVNVVNIGVYLELLRGALATGSSAGGGMVIEDLMMHRACLLRDDGPLLQLTLQEREAGFSFSMYGDSEGSGWIEHCNGRVATSGAAPAVPPPATWAVAQSGEELYEGMRGLGIELGPAGRWITAVRSTADRSRAAAELREATAGEAAFMRGQGFHPGVIDALFQAAYAVLPAEVPADSAYMLINVARMYVVYVAQSSPAAGPVRVEVTRRRWDPKGRALTVDIAAVDIDGRPLIAAEGAMLKYASRELLRAQLSAPAPSARQEAGGGGGAGAGRQALQALPAAERQRHALQRLTAISARVLGAAPAEVDSERSLLELGVDSLMAVELKRALESDFAVPVTLASLLDGPSLLELTTSLLEQMALGASGDPESSRAGAPAQGAEEPDEVSVIEPGSAASANEPFSLTDLQQAYLIGRGGAFELGNVSTYFFLEVDIVGLDLPRAQWAWNQMVERHGMLRAVFTEHGKQRVLPQVPAYEIAVADVRGLAAQEREHELRRVSGEVAGRVFDTARWPLFEIRATKLDDRTTRLHLGFDALIVDAWSTSMIFDEWSRVHRGEVLVPLTLTFRDYMEAMDRSRGGAAYARDLAYWDKRVATLPPAPELPLARTPESIGVPVFGHRTARLAPAQWAKFNAFAREAKVTPSAALCAVYAKVIATWSRTKHFTLNLLFFNRQPLHPEVKSVAANFSSTTLLEIDCRIAAPFRDFAHQVSHQLAEDLDHGRVTGVEVLRRLNRARGGRGAIMPVVFASTINLRARDREEGQFGLTSHLFKLGEGGQEIGSSIRTPQVWLDHQVLEEAGGLVCNWDVVEELFPPGLIDAMFARYQELLEYLSESSAAWTEVVGRRPLSPEQLAAREQANATAAKIPSKLLHQGFLEAAAAGPQRPAVISSARTLTYHELDVASELLARKLAGLDLGPHRLVSVFLPKGWQQVVAVLAIHKVGAAYLPMDPALPDERVAHLFRHAGARLGVTSSSLAGRLTSIEAVTALAIDEVLQDHDFSSLPGARLRSPAATSDLAYVIYTSGSTGLPKGVAVTHAAAWNTIADINTRFAISSEDRTFAISSLSFDLSVYDVFGLLAAGGAVVMPDSTEVREPAGWCELVRQHRVTIWNSVPALAQMLSEHATSSSGGLGSLRVAMLSGDWIPVALPSALQAIRPELKVVSLGGATEAAIWSIAYPIEEVSEHWSSVPYGRPLANQRFMVLDEDLRPRPVYVPGELYISGDGLALGYWNDPERTNASFIRHPRTNERLYRTGDLGRYLPDGNIEFLGREDGQVKVQGYRIELGEIEAALDRIPELRASAAAAVGERGSSKSLVAYVVPRDEAPLDLDALRRRLESSLPPYMVPSTFMVLEQLPLTSNGKVDRKALPSPSAHSQGSAHTFVPPRDLLEQRVAALWSELLGVSEPSVFDNFFALGGQSFLAMRLMARVRKEFGVSLPLGSLVSGGTIAAQAELLRHGTMPQSESPLVEIAAGDGAPVVLVHPVGGNVLCYRDLARELAPWRVLGLTAPGLAPGQGPRSTIEELASYYLAALRQAGVSAPLRLGGWSLGGVVAREMARQAEAEGQTVEVVFMLDSHLEVLPLTGARSERELLGGFLSDLARSAGLPAVEPPAHLGSGAASSAIDYEAVLSYATASGLLPADLEVDALTRLWSVYRAGILALDAYQPQLVRAPVVELWAADQAPVEARVRWSEVCSAHVRRAVGGDHYTLLSRTHRPRLIEGLLEILRNHPPIKRAQSL